MSDRRFSELERAYNAESTITNARPLILEILRIGGPEKLAYWPCLAFLGHLLGIEGCLDAFRIYQLNQGKAWLSDIAGRGAIPIDPEKLAGAGPDTLLVEIVDV